MFQVSATGSLRGRSRAHENSLAYAAITRLGTWISLGIGAVLVAIGITLAFNNPTIDNTDDGTYGCFAPYDTVLLGQRDNVGMHDNANDIEDRCYAANRDRFILASVITAVGAVATGSAVVFASRRRAG